MTSKVLMPRDGAGWVEVLVGSYWCQAKVYDNPSSVFGINGGRVSKLAVSKSKKWEGWEKVVYHYDRGLDFNLGLSDADLSRILTFLEGLV